MRFFASVTYLKPIRIKKLYGNAKKEQTQIQKTQLYIFKNFLAIKSSFLYKSVSLIRHLMVSNAIYQTMKNNTMSILIINPIFLDTYTNYIK